MHPAYGGRGLATEAVRALVALAFGPFGLHRVYAQLDPRNTASVRLCERLGMTHEAHLRREHFALLRVLRERPPLSFFARPRKIP